jgi:hypothetical protein
MREGVFGRLRKRKKGTGRLVSHFLKLGCILNKNLATLGGDAAAWFAPLLYYRK